MSGTPPTLATLTSAPPVTMLVTLSGVAVGAPSTGSLTIMKGLSEINPPHADYVIKLTRSTCLIAVPPMLPRAIRGLRTSARIFRATSFGSKPGTPRLACY